ncbi:MAG: hypothetical protein ACNA8L_08865 [Luteolibacter sp.]
MNSRSASLNVSNEISNHRLSEDRMISTVSSVFAIKRACSVLPSFAVRILSNAKPERFETTKTQTLKTNVYRVFDVFMAIKLRM